MKNDEVIITPEYKECFQAIENKEPFVFVSGKAGVGKSVLIKYLKNNLKNKNVAVIAPTGVAAINVEGQTVHSFFGFGIDILTTDNVGAAKGKKIDVIKNLDMLIIDEISMVRSDLMDAIDTKLKKTRGNEEPFGGVQVIGVGDLFQLSPVVKEDEKPYFEVNYDTEYFFSAQCLRNRKFKSIILDNVFRQKDQVFVNVLNNIRENANHRESLAQINRSCYGINAEYKDIERDITLTARNARAEEINNVQLNKLPGKVSTYEAKIKGNFKVKMVTPEILNVKPGAQVMFTKNNGNRWVNGTLGQVVSVGNDEIKVKLKDTGRVESVKTEKWEVKKYEYDYKTNKIKEEATAEFTQFPLTLAWALTIHKSQGLTLDSIKIDLGGSGKAFATGQAYVALSRCKTMDGISLEDPLSMKDVKTDPRIVDFYNIIGEQIKEEKKLGDFINKKVNEEPPEKQQSRKLKA
jgi:GTPase SAR1 family protein